MTFQSYIICATPRSGSTLLCDLLAGTGVTGHPNSFYRPQSISDWVQGWGLDPDAPDFDRTYLHVARQMGTAATGMFGMRQMWAHKLEMDATLNRLFPGLSEMERLKAAFGSIRYLYLQRDDLVAQAVSHAKAEQSGLWHQYVDGSTREQVGEKRRPIYNRTQIEAYLAEAEVDNSRWKDWFTTNGIEPLQLTYEDLADSPQATLDRILRDFGLEPVSVEIKSKILADNLSQQWIGRFNA